MRLTVLTLALALLPAATAPAAPAPLPRRPARPQRVSRQMQIDERARRLAELNVTWRVENRGGQAVLRFNVTHPSGNSAMGGTRWIRGDDLPAALDNVLRTVERFLLQPQ
jgi:hypothetical protein